MPFQNFLENLFEVRKPDTKESRIRETLNLLTNSDSITITMKFLRYFSYLFWGGANIFTNSALWAELV